MPKQDRGAPARPPWLPEEDEQRGFLRSLRPKKRGADDPESNEDSLTHETGHTSAPKTPAQKPTAESVLPPVETRAAVAPREETGNRTTPMPDVSKYYTPARAPEPPEQRPLTAAQESLAAESNNIAQQPVSDEARIVTSPIPEVKPEPRPILQVEQPQTPPSDESPVIPVPATPEAALDVEAVTPSAIEASADVADSPEPAPVTAPPEQARLLVPTADQRREESTGTDPFSRFSLLEAQLRQMSLDESITEAELERHRRHARPESAPAPEVPGVLSFTPPEAVDDAPDGVEDIAEPAHVFQDAQSVGPSPAAVLGFTHPDVIADAPEAIEESLSEAEEPTAAAEPDGEPEPEPSTAVTVDSLPQTPESDAGIVDDLAPQPPVEEEPTSVSEQPANSEAPAPSADVPDIDDVDARAAALLRRIEAKRAELIEELAAHDAADLDVSVPELEPAPFVPMIAPWAAVPEVVDSESAESSIAAESAAETQTTETTAPELEGFAPLVDEDIVIDLPVAVFEETSADPAIEDVVGSEPEFVDEPNASVTQVADPQPGDEIADTAIESTDDLQAAAEPVSEDVAAECESDREVGAGNAPSPWEVPSVVQPEPMVEPPAQPAHYVPPPAPQQAVPQQPGPEQQPAAQAPPGWSPHQPHPGQWPLGAPQSSESFGEQQFSQQQPPQPTSVEGQWQWVPQQPQAPQPPVSQELPPGYVPPPQGTAPPTNYRGPQAYRMPPSLDEAEVINRGRYAPRSGWRKAVHRSTGGRVNPGDSRKDREQDQLLASIRQPILGDYRIAVLSIKGCVGKTTTTLGLGSAFATIRTDRIIAVDANPDRGTLAERVRDHSTQSTVRDLLNDRNIRSYADVRNHTRMATSRLEVLASEQDPAVSEAFGKVDYRNTIDILERYYNIILTDCGTGIMHSAMAGVLDLAHTIVLVSSPAMDSARSASATLDWLMQHGHSALVREAHVVLSASRPGSAGIKLDKVYEHFQARCRSIHTIPFDPHLAEGADVDFNLLNADTNAAYLKLAGAISESFPRLRMRGDEQR
ncbi:AAA family ATPase [Mycobacteroides salmoniphilum]|uniref:AAA family ATPase n=1 Tax=Mycobacteroides salmoniphilum TaxID=404941 RepID=UPI001785FD84|nr:AAA family ATPase [Mycobacteroides salmoniphilum]